MTKNIYEDNSYYENNPTWHVEDSPWKADQILQIIQRNNLSFNSIAELGCGAGEILNQLHCKIDDEVNFTGYEISPQAYAMAKTREKERLNYYMKDLFEEGSSSFDILLVIDVIEHIPDYLGFVEKCKAKATYKIYHIPLEINVSCVLRNILMQGRHSVGHIHYFTADTALATIKDTGQEIIDYFYTTPNLDLYKQHPSFKKAVANVPRRILSKLNLPLTCLVMGGYELLVLAK